MKKNKNVVRLSEAQLHQLIAESVQDMIRESRTANRRRINENEEDELFDGTRNALKHGWNRLMGKDKRQGKHGMGSGMEGMTQAYRNGEAAADIQKISDLIYKNAQYLEQIGALPKASQEAMRWEKIADRVRKGGGQGVRTKGGGGQWRDYNVKADEPIQGKGRGSSVKPNSGPMQQAV